MNDHHLILGQLSDFVTGNTIDDTLDERYRQKIARILVHDKGYHKADIQAGKPISIEADGKRARVPATYIVTIDGHAAILIHYGPGSLVTRHRPALAMARLAAEHPVPVVVVTNGENADVLDGGSGRPMGSGWDAIPARAQLQQRLATHQWKSLPLKRIEMESRILMAFEVDDRCPCDDTVCRLDQNP